MEPYQVSKKEDGEKVDISSRPYISYNKYFFIPFFIWLIIGGIAMIVMDRQELFAMINTRHTPRLDVLMVYITQMGEGVFGTLLLLLLLIIRPALRNKWFFISALLTNALPNIITQAIKSGVNEPRPLNYFKNAEWIHILPEWPRLMERSFPSGHTCAAFCLFCFISFFLPKRYQGLGLLFFSLAILVGFSRLYLAAHFFHDIYVGSLIGTLFTAGIMFLLEYYRGFFFRYSSPRK